MHCIWLNGNVFHAEVHTSYVPTQNAPGEVKKVLIGNKCDMEAERVVTRAMGEEFAAKCGIPFFETSSKTDHNIKEVIYLAVNPLTPWGSAYKQKLMYSVLAPGIITPIQILMDLWRLWTHLCVRGWLSVKNLCFLVSNSFQDIAHIYYALD